jgi:hypothetical protein
MKTTTLIARATMIGVERWRGPIDFVATRSDVFGGSEEASEDVVAECVPVKPRPVLDGGIDSNGDKWLATAVIWATEELLVATRVDAPAD